MPFQDGLPGRPPPSDTTDDNRNNNGNSNPYLSASANAAAGSVSPLPAHRFVHPIPSYTIQNYNHLPPLFPFGQTISSPAAPNRTPSVGPGLHATTPTPNIPPLTPLSVPPQRYSPTPAFPFFAPSSDSDSTPGPASIPPLPEHIEQALMSSSSWVQQSTPFHLALPEHIGGHAMNRNNAGNSESFAANLGPLVVPNVNNAGHFISPMAGGESGSWRLHVDPLPFSSGLEGIGDLPQALYYAAANHGAIPPQMSGSDIDFVTGDKRKAPSEWSADVKPEIVSQDTEMRLLDGHLGEIINLMEPFALSTMNPSPRPPPPYLHTRLARLASLIRGALVSLEARSHTTLAAGFNTRPPASVSQGTREADSNRYNNVGEMSAAEREMDLIRRRRDVLIAKAAQGKTRENSAATVTKAVQPPSFAFHPLPQPAPLLSEPHVLGLPSFFSAPDPSLQAPLPVISGDNQAWRCHGCGTTMANEWMDGPDGPQSLCESCGFHYDRIARRHVGGTTIDDFDLNAILGTAFDSSTLVLGP